MNDEYRYDVTTLAYLRRPHENLIDPAIAARHGLLVDANADGVIIHASLADESDLTVLSRANIITAENVDSGLGFMKIRRIALRHLDAVVLKFDDSGGAEPDGLDTFFYQKVCRKLAGIDLHLVERGENGATHLSLSRAQRWGWIHDILLFLA